MTETATKTPKKKRNRTPMNYLLCAVQKDADGNVVGLKPVKQPPLPKGSNTRDAFKRAVRKCLEEGVNADEYNGRQLTVVGFPEPFCFKAEVETVEIRKISISEA